MAADVVTQIITARITEHVAESPFYIPMTGPAARPRRSLKHDDTFIVLDSHGDIGASAGGPDGLFNADTRYLARLEMVLEDVQPLLLGSNMRDDNSALTVDLTNSDVYRDGRLTLQKDTLHIVRSIFLWRGTAYQRIGLQNHGDHAASFDLTLLFDNDFADLFEVRGERRPRRGIGSSKLLGPTDVVLEYCGLDEQTRITALHFDPRPTRLSVNAATYHFDLEPGQLTSLFVAVSCNKPIMQKPVPFFRGLLAHRREMRNSSAGAASIETSNNIFNEVLCQAMADLNMLMTETPQGRYPYAGIPWYSTTFGRDGLITALQMLWVDPRIAKGVLKRLALFQAKAVDPLADAAPGKILHEMRGGEMAALREVPFAQYYGSVDSTPLFVLLAGLYLERTGDVETLRELWPAVEAGLQWIDGPGDPDRDGFVEYQRATEKGLRNQGWKDSFDAIFHADGTLAEGNIALAEVQGYVFAGKQLAARAARTLGFADKALKLEAEAERLRARFEEAFWCEELGTYAVALDGAKQPCRVRTSNAGQTLFSGMVRQDRARRVAADLMSQKFFSGWGIRTVAVGEARYNPMSYHDGSIWPHDNALIALGLARYGLKRSVAHLFKGLFDAASYMELRRLPELFCGFRRERRRGPVLYPVACAPQAWASATPFTLLEAALGLEFDTARGEIRLRDPCLPEFLNDVVLRDLRLGASSVDLRLRRHGDEVSLEVLRTRGQIQVSIVLTH
ncbi:amylo-alpha-1,6-glucosidase [Bradyrhizobium viridifuturi]|jgi:glycogen debranching enzyme|nr:MULTISPECIES: amylo-alpha-1,6-glucosidase [Bradyrhizobium]ERF80640.1 MAG: cysteine desulfurase/selenocysteine lyase [Bradyrhizobium sp. DFCI-1]OYU62256.1 MAG: amylo-alpha-1,6-glucosidase [Bradyrhizobium sp. PARBB1]PSO24565.1 amylo-alpha-1,6-glucosidase [Bradyrhizobium sp. MOS004]QRI71542.1 amylo-alpha-1,6-glucosidase [Bradyrhizobium sp. PSBB068]MBR1019849.1 amylo-alpha-1,6-glucosidase [Bradyrhizobium viridifuturi]